MSHMLTDRDSMAFRLLGGDPWHIGETRKRCHSVGEHVTGPEIQKAAKLDYSLEKVSLRPVDDGQIVRDVYGIRRTDTRELLSGTAVGNVYEILQPSKLFEFGDAIRATDPGSQWETAGSLFAGRRVWGLVRLNGETTVKGRGRVNDKTLPYALISTTFDGTQRTIVQHTSIRVVCWNTMSAALGETGAQFAIRHTSSQEKRMEEAAKALGHAIKWHEVYAETAQRLADTPMSREEARLFFAQILTGEDEPEDALKACRDAKGRKRDNLAKGGALLLELFESGTGNLGRDRYDAQNAVTEFVDRERARIRSFRGKSKAMQLDTALDSSQFGSGARTKARAVKLLTRW